MAFWQKLLRLLRPAPKLKIKNQKQETQLIHYRIWTVITIIALLTIILLIRLLDLQLVHYHYYQTQSHQNQINIKPIPPKRGLILDRNGRVLAKNKPVFNLIINPSEAHNLDHELAILKSLINLSPSEVQNFHQQLKLHRRFENIQLKLQLNPAQVARVAANHHRLPGIDIKAQLIRYYPLGSQLAHVIGYVGRLTAKDLKHINRSNYASTHYIGKTGIEAYYEQQLHGRTGHKEVETDANGEAIHTSKIKAAQSGDDIYLTIDSQLQKAVQKALSGYRGAAVVIQPQTGDILAMVSTPSFNPNKFVHGLTNKDYQKLLKSSGRPLYNRNVHGQYAIGSTVKPFIALQGLNTGTITPDYTIDDPGWFKIPGTQHIFHDWLRSGHGKVDLNRAITVSCDTYFYHLAYKLGIKSIDNILKQFGFGQKTGIELPTELNGTVPSPQYKRQHLGKRWYTGDTINTGIGQGYSQATPLQLAYATATLANRGQKIKPSLLYGIQSQQKGWQGNPIKKEGTIQMKDQHYWQDVIKAMQNVVPNGTGHRFGDPPYPVAAKTGTAQVISHRDKTQAHRDISNSIFIAFAPVKHPKIAVSAIVEHDPGASVSVARQIMDSYFLNS